jgi:hypothetical protein
VNQKFYFFMTASLLGGFHDQGNGGAQPLPSFRFGFELYGCGFGEAVELGVAAGFGGPPSDVKVCKFLSLTT